MAELMTIPILFTFQSSADEMPAGVPFSEE